MQKFVKEEYTHDDRDGWRAMAVSNCGVSQLSTILALVDIKYRLSQNQFDNLFPL